MFKESPTCCLVVTARLVNTPTREHSPYKLILPDDINVGDSTPYLYQYLGVRDCLCMTLTQVQRTTSIYLLAKHIPSVTWLGRIIPGFRKGYPRHYSIPHRVWCPQNGPFTGDLTLRGYGHTFTSDKTGRSYTLLFFPALTRSGILNAEYLL